MEQVPGSRECARRAKSSGAFRDDASGPAAGDGRPPMERIPREEAGKAYGLWVRQENETDPVAIGAVRAELMEAIDPWLRSAARRVARGHGWGGDTLLDIEQQARLLLWSRLVGGSLHYQDEGFDKFRGWLRSVCHSACADAALNCRPRWLEMIALADAEELSYSPAPAKRGDLWLRAARAIARLDAERQDVLWEWFTGMLIEESAAKRGISLGAMHNLRYEAGEELAREGDLD